MNREVKGKTTVTIKIRGYSMNYHKFCGEDCPFKNASYCRIFPDEKIEMIPNGWKKVPSCRKNFDVEKDIKKGFLLGSSPD